MTYPSGEPGGDEADLYDVAPDADAPATATPPAGATPRTNTSRVNVIESSPAAPARALPYRRPTEDTGGVDSYFPNKTIDFYGPLWLIGASVVVEFIATYLRMPAGVTGARAASAAMTGVGIEMVVGTVLMLAGVLIAVKFRGINLGRFWTAVLKLAATAVAPGAAMTLLGVAFDRLPIIGPLIPWVGGFVLYFALLGVFFDLDQSDTWFCVMVIFLVKLAFVAAVMFGVLPFLR